MRFRIRFTGSIAGSALEMAQAFEGGWMIRSLGEFLEREAGHVMIGLGLIMIGYALWRAGMPKSEDLTPFALGLIARSMIGSSKPKQDGNGKSSEAA